MKQSFKGIHRHIVDVEMLQMQADEAAEMGEGFCRYCRQVAFLQGELLQAKQPAEGPV